MSDGWICLDDMTSGFADCVEAFAKHHKGGADWEGETLAAHYALTRLIGLRWSPTRAPKKDEMRALRKLGAAMDAWRGGAPMYRGALMELTADTMCAIDYVHQTTGTAIWTSQEGPPRLHSRRPPVDFAKVAHMVGATHSIWGDMSGPIPKGRKKPPRSHRVKYRLDGRRRWTEDCKGYKSARHDLWLRD